MMRSRTFARPLMCAGLAAGLTLMGGIPAAVAVTAAPQAAPETSVAAGPTAGAQNYLVLYKSGGKAAGASLAAITAAGGAVVQDYSAIGVAVVKSSTPDFSGRLRAADPSVEAASSTASFGVAVHGGDEAQDAAASSADAATPAPAPGEDALGALQWDMRQIHAPEARAISGGSPSVTVGILDTGLDYSHPDLAPNIDFSKSASCVGGVPNQDPAAWRDDNGHGTHTAGTIAAAKNGLGMVGIAPNVKLAGVKVGNPDGEFYPEAVVCAFMWAAEHGIEVTNNSYYADPWYFNCKTDPQQKAIWEAERRAIRYAQSKGTTVVAALGNYRDDLAHPTADVQSPNDGTPGARDVTNACAVVPTELAGVVGVTANGSKGFKSYYSNYGSGVADVMAPGGDSRNVAPGLASGGILSTWPSYKACGNKVVDASGATYCYLQGTSMASPHAAGVAALIVSSGVKNPGTVAARLGSTADPVPCPTDMAPYAASPSVSNGAPQTCTGGAGYNSFAGKGRINALTAIGG